MRDWLSHRARIDPNAEAVVDATTDDSYTFGTLDTLVDDLAGRLSAAGVDAGDHLGAVLSPCLEYVCLIHAAMRLGSTLVPMGDGLTTRELATQIDVADVTTVVCGASTEGAVVDAVSDLESVDGGDSLTEGTAPIAVLSVDDPQSETAESLSSAPAQPVSPAEWSLEDTQLVLFTSGTTGDPKAVRLTTGNLLASAAASAFRLGFDPGDRWLATLPFHHMGGITPILRLPVYGLTVVLRQGFEAGPAADDLDRYDATAVSVVPTMLRRMLNKRGTLAETLRVVLLGGAPASAELIERCQNYSVPVHPTYGMTETASQAATARPKEAFENPESVGRPLFLTDVTVLDDDGTPLPHGEPGELVVDGPTVTPGYYGDEDATADAFGEFGLHTGDVGVVDETGRITVMNRLDDRIVTGGENVDPGEVVDVLVSHPDVREAAVVGVPDAEWGERVSALVVPDSWEAAGEPTEVSDETRTEARDALLEYANDRLADFKLPKTVAFADTLPRTVSGTVDRDAVRERFSGDRTTDEATGFDEGTTADGDRSGGEEQPDAETPAADGDRPSAGQTPDDRTSEEQPSDGSSQDEQPSDDQSSEEQPSDDQSSEEQPSDDQSSEEHPSDGQSSEKQPSDGSSQDDHSRDDHSPDDAQPDTESEDSETSDDE